MALIDQIGFDGWASPAALTASTDWGTNFTLQPNTIFGVAGEQWAQIGASFDRVFQLPEATANQNDREFEMSFLMRIDSGTASTSSPLLFRVGGSTILTLQFQNNVTTGINHDLHCFNAFFDETIIEEAEVGKLYYITIRASSETGPSPSTDGTLTIFVNGELKTILTGVQWSTFAAQRSWDDTFSTRFQFTSGMTPHYKSIQLYDSFTTAVATPPAYVYVWDRLPDAIAFPAAEWTGVVGNLTDGNDATVVSTTVGSSELTMTFPVDAALSGNVATEVVSRMRASRDNTAFNIATISVGDGVIADDSETHSLAALDPARETVTTILSSGTGWDVDTLEFKVQNGA